eukprot:TRINITY_DN2618_c0_g1_i1.p1 TRINITY_DN2618_c0_g1~~TRINITY_DN2618_c0_g1_i1.p1  ORF type:complete len:350 (+),score=168.63 TRINITY_DN2618_c0_g1_i1:64-1113(+)
MDHAQKMKMAEKAAEMCGLSMDEVMGISKNNETPVEKEAHKIWQHLDNLASTDKAEYKRFVEQQMKEGKEFFDKYPDGQVPEPQPNIPVSKFWVETDVLEDRRPIGIPRYFNICESDAMEYTDDKNLNIYMSDLVNRQIDCVIHPNFMKKCLDDNVFMHDTLLLIFDTYKAEHKECEVVRKQYKHHAEPRKLVMKVPKPPGAKGKKKQPETPMDILSKVRHSDAAKKMMADEKDEVHQRLFQLYGEKAAAPDPVTEMPAAKPAKKKPEIIELKPKLPFTLVDENGVITVRVTLPEGTSIGDVELELEGDDMLLVSTAACEPLRVKLPRKGEDMTAKFIKAKQLLKVLVK